MNKDYTLVYVGYVLNDLKQETKVAAFSDSKGNAYLETLIDDIRVSFEPAKEGYSIYDRYHIYHESISYTKSLVCMNSKWVNVD